MICLFPHVDIYVKGTMVMVGEIVDTLAWGLAKVTLNCTLPCCKLTVKNGFLKKKPVLLKNVLDKTEINFIKY